MKNQWVLLVMSISLFQVSCADKKPENVPAPQHAQRADRVLNDYLIELAESRFPGLEARQGTNEHSFLVTDPDGIVSPFFMSPQAQNRANGSSNPYQYDLKEAENECTRVGSSIISVEQFDALGRALAKGLGSHPFPLSSGYFWTRSYQALGKSVTMQYEIHREKVRPRYDDPNGVSSLMCTRNP